MVQKLLPKINNRALIPKGNESETQMLDFISRCVHWFASPLVHIPVLILFGWLLKHLWNNRLVGNLVIGVGCLWFLFCSLTYTSVLLIHPLEHQYPTIKVESNAWRDVDAIVVLACYFFDDDSLPFVSKWPNCTMQRNLHAVLMYRQKALPIYVSGGIRPGADTTYAYQNAQFLITMGVPESAIKQIPIGYNTQTEAHALSKELARKKIALVTSASHIQRAKYYFETDHMTVLPIPVDYLSNESIKPILDLPNARSLDRSEQAIYEYLGLAYQYLFVR